MFDRTEFERLAAMGPGFKPDAPYLDELQRLYESQIPNVFPPPNIGVDVVQRERERLGKISFYYASA